MKPVNSITTGRILSDHKDAKPDLCAAMGEFCCYCERRLDADMLHVEHIKPQISYPNLSLAWKNYLLACSRCNTYKRHYQGRANQRGILRNQAWPHLDNSFVAYAYDQFGRISIRSSILNSVHSQMAQKTLDMAGLDRTPAASTTYEQLGIDYDNARRRCQTWKKAEIARTAYLQNPTNEQLDLIVNQALDAGYFSIWMEVFAAIQLVRVRFVSEFKASAACFDSSGNPIPTRSAGRI